MIALKRLALALICTLLLPLAAAPPAMAQSVTPPEDAATPEPVSKLEDILARQAGLDADREPRDFDGLAERGAPGPAPLGTLGGASDAEAWEALRFGTADVTVSAGGPTARVVMQDGGMWWQQFRRGPLAEWGGWFLLGMIGLLALFYLLRGRIRIEHGRSGVTLTRFTAFERFSHWLLAGSFILLALTGLTTLFGRKALELIDDPERYAAWREDYASLALYAKWIHNNVSWAFMLGLVLVLVLWIVHNIPNRTDLVWFAKGGGIIGKGHPPAKKFNGGQKIVFWAVILLGASVAASGLSLLFPFELPLFAKTFAVLNDIGAPGWLGMEPLPVQMSPQEEMQYAQLWHAIVSFVMMGVILGHIYIGTLGMEGAYDAMGSGEVDLNWAREHHSLWVAEVEDREARRRAETGGPATPAE
jgi:formate dehydrogenase subunit gamma